MRTQTAERTDWDRLSERQREIVCLKCSQDLTHHELADQIGISSQTVKNHVAAIMHKTDARSMHNVCYRLARDIARQTRNKS